MLTRFKIKYAFIRQEHNIIYNHMNENNTRLETSTKEQKDRYHRRHKMSSIDHLHSETKMLLVEYTRNWCLKPKKCTLKSSIKRSEI